MKRDRTLLYSYISILSLLVLLIPGSKAIALLLTSSVVINEIDYDQPGSDTAEFIEIKNNSDATINLDAYSLALINGVSGGATIYHTIVFPNVDLAPGEYFVVCGDSTTVTNCDLDDATNENLIQNGAPDAVALLFNGGIIDSVSYEGDTGAPYTEGSGAGLLDDPAVGGRGISRCPDANDTDQNNQDFDFVAITPGSANACPELALVINEIDADQAGADAAEFIELYDGGLGNTPLDGLALVFYNGLDGPFDGSYRAFDLDGYATDASGYFVLCGDSLALPGCDADVTPDADLIQNGPDAVALYQGEAADFPTGTAVTTAGLIDAIVYDTDDPDDDGLLVLLNSAQPQVNENTRGEQEIHSSQRCPNGAGGARNTVGYHQWTPTPGAENACNTTPAFGACGDPATRIHDIQGAGLASPLTGQKHVIQGVVIGDYQDPAAKLGGFFVQEEYPDFDTEDSHTSEGLFVFDNGFGVDVSRSQVVRLLGTVTELDGLTELNAVTNVAVCGQGIYVERVISLPIANLSEWEAMEGMAVGLAGTLVVVDNFNLGRYGEVELAAEGRLYAPTSIASPGAAALALQDLHDRSRMQLDDGSSVQYPLPLPPYLDPDSTLRVGDTRQGLTGVLGYSNGSYEIHPIGEVTFTRANERSLVAPAVEGNLRMAAMNAFNYFTTLNTGAPICGPSGNLPCRGASTPAEFTRQRDKLVSALTRIDADILGLMEIENNASAAIQDLVNGLNAATSPGAYAFIDTGVIGSDAIKVALIYKPASVTPLGAYAILDSTVDPDFLDAKNRPSLAQTFQTRSGAKLTVVVNHFKSKASACDDVGDPDTVDGQGNCNLTRLKAAQALADWLATDPTGSGDPDILILGDLNAYAMEDPIAALVSAGYTNLVEAHLGAGAYTNVFEGQSGYLDHVLASGRLASQVMDVQAWHINADEPSALGWPSYNQPALYQPDLYRSSDHDPLIIGVKLEVDLFLPLIRSP